jgi:hypothetical protein
LQPVHEGAQVALETVNQEAGEMRQIQFVLWDDHIYDAWIDKAKELKFLLLHDDDNDAAAATGTSKKSTDDKKNSTQKSSSNDDQPAAKQEPERKVIDASTPDAVIQASKTDHDESHDRSGLISTEQSDNQENLVDKGDDGTKNEDKDPQKQERYVMSTAE